MLKAPTVAPSIIAPRGGKATPPMTRAPAPPNARLSTTIVPALAPLARPIAAPSLGRMFWKVIRLWVRLILSEMSRLKTFILRSSSTLSARELFEWAISFWIPLIKKF